MLLTPGPFLWSRDTNYYHHIHAGTRPGPENAVGTVSRGGQTPPGPAHLSSPPSCAGIWITFYLFIYRLHLPVGTINKNKLRFIWCQRSISLTSPVLGLFESTSNIRITGLNYLNNLSPTKIWSCKKSSTAPSNTPYALRLRLEPIKASYSLTEPSVVVYNQNISCSRVRLEHQKTTTKGLSFP